MNLLAWFKSWRAERLERKFLASLPADITVTFRGKPDEREREWSGADLFDHTYEEPEPLFARDVIGIVPLPKEEREQVARNAQEVYGPVEDHLGEDSIAMQILREEGSTTRMGKRIRDRKLVIQPIIKDNVAVK
jgi:hypothetical protein